MRSPSTLNVKYYMQEGRILLIKKTSTNLWKLKRSIHKHHQWRTWGNLYIWFDNSEFCPFRSEELAFCQFCSISDSLHQSMNYLFWALLGFNHLKLNLESRVMCFFILTLSVCTIGIFYWTITEMIFCCIYIFFLLKKILTFFLTMQYFWMFKFLCLGII